MTARRYWIGVVAGDDVAIAVHGGFVQVNHGRAAPLERMRPGDGFAFYSPRERLRGGAVLQQFTAIGTLCEGPLELTDGPEGQPLFRRPMTFLPSTPAPIKPLVGELSFLRSKAHWGVAFRFGFLPVPEADFARITQAMGRSFDADFPGDTVQTGVPAS